MRVSIGPAATSTGNAGFSIELDAKRLELLSELAPAARVIGALVNPNRPGVEAQEKEMLAAAKTAGRELTVLHTGDARAIELAFVTLAERKITALLVGADAIFNNHRTQIIALAARQAMTAVYPWSEFVTEGGLVSNAPNLPEAYRLSGLYVGRILKGEKPADLPVIQPAKVELVINLKTAKALGLEVPPSLLAQAMITSNRRLVASRHRASNPGRLSRPLAAAGFERYGLLRGVRRVRLFGFVREQ